MKHIRCFFCAVLITVGWAACTSNEHQAPAANKLYTCPMPQDSVFSDKPGKCPKCGMELVKVEQHVHETASDSLYTCPMPEDSVFSSQPGNCPKCGMNMVPVSKKVSHQEHAGADLSTLLRPTNEFVVSALPVTSLQVREEDIEVEALGKIAYDTRLVGSISARVAGRIEKLYIRYRYQRIAKGQHILDIYSPELLTAQQNLLFLLQHDPANKTFIEAAREKLLLLGMTTQQLQALIRTAKPLGTIAVYSNYSGHIHDAPGNAAGMLREPGEMKDVSQLTGELSLKEGMYLQKGQTIFSVYNPAKAWVLLNIYGDNQALIKVGDKVRVVPETAPDKDFRASISFVEPFFRKESKTLAARVYFDNSLLKIPIGSQVKATVFGTARNAAWLPHTAVLSLGLDRIVFVKESAGFQARRITVGIRHQQNIQVVDGLSGEDSVAVNAQFLMDSESFIKTKNGGTE